MLYMSDGPRASQTVAGVARELRFPISSAAIPVTVDLLEHASDTASLERRWRRMRGNFLLRIHMLTSRLPSWAR